MRRCSPPPQPSCPGLMRWCSLSSVVGAMGAVRVAGVREVASGVEAFGFAAATEAAGVMEAGEVVGAVVVITAAGARNSNIAKASAAVIFEVIQVLRERTRLNWVHAELGDRFLPEPLGKYTQHLGPLVLAHHSAIGDYSADVIVGAEKRLETLRIVVSAPKCPTELFQILTCVYKGIRPAIGIPKRIQHLLLECSPISALITAHHYHLLAHIQALFCFLFYSFCIHCSSQFTEDVSPRSDQSTRGITELHELTGHFMESTTTPGTDQSLHGAMAAQTKITKTRSN